eukprot:CAMPEP_0171296494 /NCGR_PEP_ID=MMETSP0816-20121228/5163_1 /TAXON_ID=420281 /ORGANISM="Proboscia inermis, Strain CCAP1064/1" /LENGTH=50 /DNA_ID=CAMNT_0011769973 /DNA_START=1 /DNA_END=153 /DNA_ORIENTATION=-
MAANRALDALKNEMQEAMSFLPYLEAIEDVRIKQQKETEEVAKKESQKKR